MLHLDLIGLDNGGKRRMIAFGLVCVRLGERSKRAVEYIASTQDLQPGPVP